MTPVGRKRLVDALALTAIGLLVLALYWQAIGYPFVDLDDLYGVAENPGIRDLSWDGIRFLFLDDQRDFRYFPLSYLSFAVDYAFFGLDPRSYHGTNILLHLLNTGLVFALIQRLTGDRLVAAVTSLLFGLHPLQVESVAWVSSRKNVLFMAFFLASAHSYWSHLSDREARPARSRVEYVASVALFALSCLAKTAAVTLPAVLMLLDLQHSRTRPRSVLAFLKESLPSKLAYLPVIAFVWWMTRRLAVHSPFLTEFDFSWYEWATIIGHNFFLYVAKCLVPIHLGVFYPLPSPDVAHLPAHFHLFALLTLALAAIGIWSWHHSRTVFFGLAWYAATILPMAILPVFFQDLPLLAADRFFYQSAVGLFFLVGSGSAWLWRRAAPGPWLSRASLAALALAVIAANFALADRHRASFSNTIALYENLLRHHPSDAFYYRLAIAYEDAGDERSAFRALESAEMARHQIFFTRIFAYQMRISDLYRRKGDYLRAAEFLEEAIHATPNHFEPVPTQTPLAYLYLAELFDDAEERDRAAEARARARDAVPQSEGYFEGKWFSSAPERARGLLERRVVRVPGDGMAWFYLGALMRHEGQLERSEFCLRRARELGFSF